MQGYQQLSTDLNLTLATKPLVVTSTRVTTAAESGTCTPRIASHCYLIPPRRFLQGISTEL